MQNRGRSMLAEETVFAGRYRIVRRLSRGGMGAVYEAQHLETERACALKVMLPHVAESPAQRERFRQEAKAAAKVSSTHVVEVLDAGVDEATGSPFLVMELLAGEDLQKRIARLGGLSASEVSELLMQAARGIEALHRASIVHRDLKPSNLFLSEREGEDPRVKVLDLGVAKTLAESAATTAAVGTPFYMAPEQLQNGRVSAATDVYAFGMVAYSLLVGREYWAAEAEDATSAVALALVMLDGPQEKASARAAALGVTLPEAFDAWFEKATAKEPEARFGGAIAAAEVLAKSLGAQTYSMESAEEPVIRGPALGETIGADELGADPERETAGRTRTLSIGDEPVKTNPEAGPALTNPEPPAKASAGRKARLGVGAIVAIAALVALAIVFLKKKQEVEAPVNTPQPPRPIIMAVHCEAAERPDEGGSPLVMDALGKGACARLGVELGVPWGEGPGDALAVRLERGEGGRPRVTLTIAGQTEFAEDKTLLGATNEAIKKLSPKLGAPHFTPERIDAWGSKDEAGAWRIERALRRAALGFTADRVAEAEAIVKTNPESPVPNVLLACARRKVGDEAGSALAKEEALAKLSAVPKARARLLEGLMRAYVKPANAEEMDRGVRLLIASYGELAEDPDFAGLYTLCGCIETDQTLPMTDWIAERWPSAGLPMLRCSFRAVKRGDERLGNYIRWTRALPEVLGYRIDELLTHDDVGAARYAVDTIVALQPEGFSRAEMSRVKALVALAELDAKKALDAAEAMLGDPDTQASYEGARLRIQALLMGGKIGQADESTWLEVGRQGAVEQAERADDLAAEALRLRRLLRRSDNQPAWLEEIQKRVPRTPKTLKEVNRITVELILLDTRENANEAQVPELGAMYKIAEGLSWQQAREQALAAMLPLVRRVRGAEKAAALYGSLTTDDAKLDAALEGGLALEAIGKKREAAEAYRRAMSRPWDRGFDAIAARLRLGAMPGEGRTNDSLAKAAEAWSDVDKTTRDALRTMGQ